MGIWSTSRRRVGREAVTKCVWNWLPVAGVIVLEGLMGSSQLQLPRMMKKLWLKKLGEKTKVYGSSISKFLGKWHWGIYLSMSEYLVALTTIPPGHPNWRIASNSVRNQHSLLAWQGQQVTSHRVFLMLVCKKKNTSRANHYFNGGGSPGSNQSYICSDLAATRLHRLLSLHAMRAICWQYAHYARASRNAKNWLYTKKNSVCNLLRRKNWIQMSSI